MVSWRRADQLFALAAGADEVGDGADFEAVELGEGDEVRQAGHGTVFVEDFADDAGGEEAGHPRDVDRRLRVAGADQSAAGAGHEGEDVAWGDQVGARGFGVDGGGDGVGAVAGGDAVSQAFAGVDGDGEGGLVLLAVGGGHHREAELFDVAGGHGEADEAAGVAHHEGQGLGGGELGGDDEVALVFAVLVVDEDEHAAGAGFADQLVGGGKGRVQADGVGVHSVSLRRAT